MPHAAITAALAVAGLAGHRRHGLIGAVLLVIVIAGGAYYFWQRRKSRLEHDQHR